MQWFKHDTDAATDAKIKKLVIRYGAIGYAIYFHCLELIMGDIGETNITFELEHDSEIIADNLRIQGTADKSAIAVVEEVMRYIVALHLFDEVDGHIFCFKLLKRLDLSMTSNPRLRTMITEAKSSHDKVMMRHDTVMLEEKRVEEIRKEDKKEDRANALPPPKNCKSKKENERHILPSYGEGFPVYLSDEEKAKLISRYSEPVILDFIEKVSLWQPQDKKRPENDYLTLLNWLRRDKVPEVKHVEKCKKCGGTLATIGDYIGTCFDDECDMYHKEQI